MWQYAMFEYNPETGHIGTVEYSKGSAYTWDAERNEQFRQAREDGLGAILGLLGRYGWEMCAQMPGELRSSIRLMFKQPLAGN